MPMRTTASLSLNKQPGARACVCHVCVSRYNMKHGQNADIFQDTDDEEEEDDDDKDKDDEEGDESKDAVSGY